ncbi:MAG: hypothetical protein M3O35_17225, partial [Acidobacteriota bacterium]|nr:hypothetical protein [Acidobacteriota bacterium]
MKPCLAQILLICLVAAPFVTAQDSDVTDPLLRVLTTKGIITAEEAKAVNAAGSQAEQRDRLATLLRDKGLLTDNELASVTQRPAGPRTRNEPVLLASASTTGIGLPPVIQSPKPVTAAPPATPPIIAAIAPIRLLPIDPVKKEGLIPDIKLGSGARIKPYGFFKSSVIYDTSSPGGNDMPLVGFLGDTGPDMSPEFHVKARAFRIG